MKKRLIISTVLASLLSITALQASGLTDSVAKKEAAAMQNPSSVKNEAQAKAKIEEARSKDQFEAKQEVYKFQKEAKQDTMKTIRQSVQKEVNYQHNHFKKAPKEVITGFNQTLKAMDDIVKNKIDDAVENLQKATKNFDTALKNDPKLGLIPLANDIRVDAFEGNSKIIKNMLDSAKKLLSDGDTQAARALLIPLEDQMTISTESIPMNTFPTATKKATKALKDGKRKEALSILLTSLHSVVITTTVIPIPLLDAQDLIISASKLDKSKKDEATKLLVLAQDELQKAVLLGYTKKHSKEYQTLNNEIEKIKKEIKGENKVEKLYDHLKQGMDSLVKETRKDITDNQKK